MSETDDLNTTGDTGLSASSAATESATSAESGAAAAGTDPRLNPSPHLFKLRASEPTIFDGGTLQGAHEQNFPVLRGQQGSVYFVRLEVGGIREAHWHPTAWELNYIIAGKAKWTILGTHPDGAYHNDAFEADEGDLVFAPQGFFHYFENASATKALDVLVIFNTSTTEPNDDIGIVGTLNSLPRDVLAATFGVPVSAFDGVPTEIKPVVITRRK
ncbi:cupin domain-containing protein [Saccharopolyspora phatthalungensis]|uniref:Oxalate decarboxylase n=1 Tax=Saccharopolyspora phatthalungensis TaxID=664693 RepID=A0A840QEV2_9PSEU|nr:cupin domain-containing protein [Saccharopolyspora phatthalungensis]MBB5159344.1 oxalate decarboxylase [Saccharopolyspora phatthalungensis]